MFRLTRLDRAAASATFTTLAALAALAAAPAEVRAQTAPAPKVFHACYVPSSGTVYRIKEADLKQQCAKTTHVQFSWTDGASTPGLSQVSEVTGDPVGAAGGVGSTVATASCPAGTTLVGGGYSFFTYTPSVPPFVYFQGRASLDLNSWEVHVDNTNGTGRPPIGVVAKALCAQ